MSSPGWYPDPDPSAPAGRMRFWDGAVWTDQLAPSPEHTDRPGSPQMAPATPDLTKREPAGRRDDGGGWDARPGPDASAAEQGNPSHDPGPLGYGQHAGHGQHPGHGQQPGHGEHPGYGQPGAPGQHAVLGQVPPGYGQPHHQQLPPGAPPPGYAPKPTHLPDGTALANVWKRLGAYLIDSLIISAISFPVILLAVGVPLGLGGGFDATQGATEPGTGVVIGMLVGYLLAFLVMAAISYWYFLHRVRRVGATFGKQWLGMQIRDWHRPGQLTWSQVLFRGLVPYLINYFTGGLFGLVDVLWCLWDPHRQTLHDKMAGTVVVDHQVPRAMPGSLEVELAMAMTPPAGWAGQGPEPVSPPDYPYLS